MPSGVGWVLGGSHLWVKQKAKKVQRQDLLRNMLNAVSAVQADQP